MSLPIVLEIAVGLIFIYLTLSLVASEIQEILSALFQWRAEHLKRSIEQLLAGETHPSQTAADQRARGQNQRAAKTLADRLYESPLIENLNYEAQGRLPRLLRSLLHAVGALYRVVTFSRNVFGRKTSGPSYIPAETFATSLMERLRLEDFQRILVRSRFESFLQEQVSLPLHDTVNGLRAQLRQESLFVAEMDRLDRMLADISADLDARRLTLTDALAQVLAQLRAFENMVAETPLADLGADAATIQSFRARLRYLRAGIGGADNPDSQQPSPKVQALLARLQPSLAELTALLDPGSSTYVELVALAQREGDTVRRALDILDQEVLPPRLRDSLRSLASQAEARVRSASTMAGNEIQELHLEIETWFNNGMERASGVYRRNGKGVGLLIGFVIAILLNADTFYMFQRLSTDQAVRNSILQTADQIDVTRFGQVEALSESLPVGALSEELAAQMTRDLRSVSSAIENVLSAYPLPIGRTEAVIKAQQEAEKDWPIPWIPQRFVGWSITALALSMGASFWFDLLRKITSVRSSGNRPKS